MQSVKCNLFLQMSKASYFPLSNFVEILVIFVYNIFDLGGKFTMNKIFVSHGDIILDKIYNR